MREVYISVVLLVVSDDGQYLTHSMIDTLDAIVFTGVVYIGGEAFNAEGCIDWGETFGAESESIAG